MGRAMAFMPPKAIVSENIFHTTAAATFPLISVCTDRLSTLFPLWSITLTVLDKLILEAFNVDWISI